MKDSKLVQRGVNVQDNDLAVPPGTLQRAINIDFYRGGVASKRTGFESMFNGIPQYEVDATYNPGDPIQSPVNRSIWELFSRDHLMMNANGMIFAYDEVQDYWYSVPCDLPHRYTLFGTITAGGANAVGFGNALLQMSGISSSPFYLQANYGPTTILSGTICNDASQAKDAVAGVTLGRFRQVGDVVQCNGTVYVSDVSSIRNATAGASSVLAGSITATGFTNATGGSALFNGASWMATNGTNTIWVADNTNAIRKVTVPGGVVTTLAGSVTAGDTDGVGTAALFRTISGLAYDGSQFLYATESAGHRVRKIDVVTGSVTIFAGLLSPATSGYVDATGTSARFNTPVGIELVNGGFYIGDSGNNRIRTMTTGAVVGTLNNVAGTLATDGLVGNVAANAITPGVVVRGQFTSAGSASVTALFPQGTYLCIECTPTVTAGTIDCGLVNVTAGAPAAAQHVYHFARCPSAYPTATTGPNKFDSVGPNAYGYADTRAVDVGGGIAMTTAERVRAIDIWTKLGVTDTMPRLRSLGVFQPEAPVVASVSGTTFAANTSWAYRTVCGLKLPDGRITLGPPSERIIMTTVGATASGSVTAFPPPGLPYDGLPFVQVYRTKTSTSASTDPGDQMFLCYETPLTYGQGLVFTDQTPDALLGAELYTNATSDGPAFASLPPPNFATELCSFNQQLVLGNFIPTAQVRIKLLGTSNLVAGTSNLQLTLKPLFGVSTYAGSSLILVAISGATVAANNQFQIATGGSIATNTAQTARNIVSVINRSPDAHFFRAFYDENDPGAFVVQAMFPGSSKTQAATNALGQTLTQAQVAFSTNTTLAFFTESANIATRTQNAAIYSDVNEPDSMPAIYQFNIGPATEAIQRMLPIADRFIAVKDDSCWSVDQTFGPQIYDTALSTNFPNSFSKINNQWIGLFTRGFCALNSSQAVAVGHQIDRDVITNLATALGSVNFVSSAAIDVYGNYLCTVNDRTYCYNILSQAWSEWQINTQAFQSPQNTAGVLIPGAGIARFSGMQSIGAFRDCFVATRDYARAVFRQRDWRRGGASAIPVPALFPQRTFFENFSDASYALSGTLAADQKTITGSYSSAGNPGILPPNGWQIPGGTNPIAYRPEQFRWIAIVSQSSVAVGFGSAVLTFSNESSATSSFTLTMDAVVGGTPGAVTVTAYPYILARCQYAPAIAPGLNAQFGDVIIESERWPIGPIATRFFNRRDLASLLINPIFAFPDSVGVARVNSPAVPGINNIFTYTDTQRVPTPGERATDQQVIVEIWEGSAWSPFAIKNVAIDKRDLDNGKIKQ